MRLGSGGLERLGPFVRTGEAEDLMPGGDEFIDDGGADESGRAGKEYTHDVLLSRLVELTSIRPETETEKVVTLYRYAD